MELEKVYNFKYVGETELVKASESVVEAALLVRESTVRSSPESEGESSLDELSELATPQRKAEATHVVEIDELFFDSSLTDYLFQAGSPFVIEE